MNTGHTTPKADLTEIKRALSVLYKPGDVVELRALDVARKTIAGYFDDFEKLAEEALKLSGHAAGVYVVLNRIKPALLARYANHTTVGPENLTKDKNIIDRRYLPIDVDAVRDEGISSTDSEHEAALAKGRECAEYLTTIGFPKESIIMGDSGNGGYLLVRIDLTNNQDSTALITKCLKALAARFDDDKAVIDTAVFNAARIWKLPGTLACKGDSTQTRPHRIARLIDISADVVIATIEALQALADSAPKAEAPKQNKAYQQGGGKPFDVEAWLAKNGIEVKSAGPYEGGTRWILKACTFNPEHTGTSAAVIQLSSGAIVYRCQHNGCAGKTWADLRELKEPGYKNRQGLFDNTYAPASDAQIKPGAHWPVPLAAEAYHGLVGEVVQTIEPHTEGDSAAILANFLAAFGNSVGRGPHARAEADRHSCNLNIVQVGETSKGRKGSAWGHIRELFSRVDPVWTERRIASGLSSGEGLIWEVRDPIEKMVKGEVQVVDEGMTDKRLLVCEAEFSAPLKVMAREGNTLSATIRQAWDSGGLRILTKNSPAKATGAHISILGHVTKAELLRYLNDIEAGNGFANRFLWVCVRRSKVLPEGGGCPSYQEIMPRLKVALDRAGKIGELKRDDEAKRLWADIYPDLSEGKPGLFGTVTARAEAQVLRLSVIYAALDGDSEIRPDHLLAALAIWDYCEASARYIFGDALGDPVADRIHEALRQSPEGLSRTNIYQLFAKHTPTVRIEQALGLLQTTGRARREVRNTEGRPVEIWRTA